MPVEDRLRRGLEANARSFVPEAERRLVDVHRRHRRDTAWLGVVAVAAAAIVAVAALALGSLLGGSDPNGAREPARPPTEVPSSSDDYVGPRIPDSDWRKVVTRDQFARAGADQAFFDANLGEADELPVRLSFVGDVYTQSARYTGSWAVGDAGTFSYDPDGRLVLSSTAPGCRGCRASLTWSVRGDQLRLAFDDPPTDQISAALLEGVWTRIRP